MQAITGTFPNVSRIVWSCHRCPLWKGLYSAVIPIIFKFIRNSSCNIIPAVIQSFQPGNFMWGYSEIIRFYYFIIKPEETLINSFVDFILTKVLCMAIIVTIGEI